MTPTEPREPGETEYLPSMFFEAATDEAECGWYLCRFWLPNMDCGDACGDCGLVESCRKPPTIRIQWGDEIGGESAACDEHAAVARREWQSMITRLSIWDLTGASL